MEKVGERRFVLDQHSCMMYLSSKIYSKLITFFSYQKFVLEEYNYDNNQKLQPVGFLKKTVPYRYQLPGKIKLFFSVWNTIEFACFQIPLGKSALHLIGFFWEPKTESFCEATSKGTCFFLYLEKGKLFMQLLWLLSFTMVAKMNTFSVEFLLPWKIPPKKTQIRKTASC